MANMSYCRFENTSQDLQDCFNYLCKHETLDDLSNSEKCFAKRLLQMCVEIADFADDLLESN